MTTTRQEVEKHLISRDKQKEFMLAGNSRFTIYNSKSGNKFSFRVKKSKKDKFKGIFFVEVDTNLENRKRILEEKIFEDNKIKHSFQYNYVGYIKNERYIHSGKSKLSEDSEYNKVFDWLFRNVCANMIPDEMEFFHNNHCARCGKTLRVPESIVSGFGPECEKIRNRS